MSEIKTDALEALLEDFDTVVHGRTLRCRYCYARQGGEAEAHASFCLVPRAREQLTALRARVAQGEADTMLDVLCPTCYGRGYVPTPHAMDTRTTYPCPTCHGNKTVSVRAREVIGRVTTTYSATPESSHA